MATVVLVANAALVTTAGTLFYFWPSWQSAIVLGVILFVALANVATLVHFDAGLPIHRWRAVAQGVNLLVASLGLLFLLGSLDYGIVSSQELAVGSVMVLPPLLSWLALWRLGKVNSRFH